MAFSPDGKTVLTGSDDKRRGSGTPPPASPSDHPGSMRTSGDCAVAFSPDGKTVLTGSDDKTARLWDAATGSPFGPPMTASGMVCAVAFSPDGKTVLTGSRDKTARLWDAADRPARRTAHGASGLSVNGVAFSPDGKSVLTGSQDKTARLWDAATGQPSGRRCSIRTRSVPWPSAPTARPCSPAARTRRRGSGTPPPASPSDHR